MLAVGLEPTTGLRRSDSLENAIPLLVCPRLTNQAAIGSASISVCDHPLNRFWCASAISATRACLVFSLRSRRQRKAQGAAKAQPERNPGNADGWFNQPVKRATANGIATNDLPPTPWACVFYCILTQGSADASPWALRCRPHSRAEERPLRPDIFNCIRADHQQLGVTTRSKKRFFVELQHSPRRRALAGLEPATSDLQSVLYV